MGAFAAGSSGNAHCGWTVIGLLVCSTHSHWHMERRDTFGVGTRGAEMSARQGWACWRDCCSGSARAPALLAAWSHDSRPIGT